MSTCPAKWYKLTRAPIEDSNQPAHPRSLIRVFNGRSLGSQRFNVSSGEKLVLWSDCADAPTHLNHRSTHMPNCTLCCIPATIECSSRIITDKALLVGGGVHVPLFPWNNLACSPVPQNSKICVLMFTIPQYCLCTPVLLKIWPLFPCSYEINAIFRCSPKLLGGPHR